MVDSFLIGIVPLLPLAGFVLIGLLNRRLSKGFVSFVACGSVLLAFALSVAVLWQLLSGAGAMTHTWFTWIAAGDFSVAFSFLADPLSALMMLVITGVGFLIHVYSIGYMHDDPGFNRFFAYLNLFIFFMLMLVMGSNYLLMFVGWEGVGLCSYLLIGFWFKNRDYNQAANKAFIMNRIGDLGMILGIILIFIEFGSIDYAEVFPMAAALSPGEDVITWIAVLLFIGAVGKSAQIPLFTWLPDAMAGPTPVSALIHAATMVTAGIYMIARSNILYTLSPVALEIVTVTGLATALMAATIAVAQNDIKKVLAYSTVSQLGLMFVAMGVGAYASGMFHMMTHAFFKALLFLGAGSVIHAMGSEQDLRRMGGLRKYLPVTWITFLAGTLAISGIPPFSGFFSKDEILASAFSNNMIVWALALITSLLTVFYMFRLFFLTFGGDMRMDDTVKSHLHESPRNMTVPLVVLAVLSVAGGWVNIPAVFGGSHALTSFLSPVFADSSQLLETHHLSHATEYLLMGLVVAMTAVIIIAAYRMYIGARNVPAADESSLTGLTRLFNRKYYIDEVYAAIVVRPLYALSNVFHQIIDRSLIDRIINASGSLVQWGSNTLRHAQTGNTGFYIFIMVVSVIVILAFNQLIS